MGSPALRIARLALYVVWTLGLMPVQGVGLALRRLEKDLTYGKRDQVMTDLDHELHKD